MARNRRQEIFERLTLAVTSAPDVGRMAEDAFCGLAQALPLRGAALYLANESGRLPVAPTRKWGSLSEERRPPQADHCFSEARVSAAGRLVCVPLLGGGVLALHTVRAASLHERRWLQTVGQLLGNCLRQLRQSETLAQISRQRTDFLALMTHELRTPLNAVLGFSDIMSDAATETTPQEMREYALLILDSGKHLLRLVNDLLDLANPKTLQDDLHLDLLQLRPLLDGMVEALRPLAVGHGIALQTACSCDEKVAVLADRSRLKQVLYNLLANAVKFSSPQQTVTLGARQEGGRCILWVEDRGVGIEPDLHEKIFEPFFQADQGSTRSVSGAGLGLALARRNVRMHGGDLTVKSQPGQGSRFEFSVESAVVGARTARS